MAAEAATAVTEERRLAFEGYSLSGATVLTRLPGGESHRFYGVRGVPRLELDYDSKDPGHLEIEAAYVSFDTLSFIFAAPLGGQAGTYALPLRPAPQRRPWPVILRSPSRDTRGEARTMDFVLYRVRFSGLRCTMAYKDGMACTVTGRVLLSPADEHGKFLEDGPEYGRFVNSPGLLTGF